MLKSGQLPTLKALVERYVHRVVVGGEHIEIQFNLCMSSRVVTYPAALYKKEIPQHFHHETTEVFTFHQQKLLATYGVIGDFVYF